MSDKKYADFANRLTKLIDNKGTSIKEISDTTGINYEMVRRYANGIAKPREDKLKLLADFLDTSITYLDYGTGTMDKRSEIIKQPVKSNLEILSNTNLRKVPIINMVQAGQWTASFDNRYDEYIEVPDVYGRDVFGLRIDGFSMIPDFYPDDIVFIDPNIEPLNGDYVIAANASYESTFKRYKKYYNLETTEEWFELIPSNAEFTVIDSRIDPFQIIGVAVGRHQFFRRGRN